MSSRGVFVGIASTKYWLKTADRQVTIVQIATRKKGPFGEKSGLTRFSENMFGV